MAILFRPTWLPIRRTQTGSSCRCAWNPSTGLPACVPSRHGQRSGLTRFKTSPWSRVP